MSRRRTKTRTYVYIDGFNFYYGCFKHPARVHWSKYKWLDLEKFCDSLLPRDDVAAVKYYTADVSNRPPDSRQSDRQQAYLKALSTLPRVEVVKGYFKGPDVRWMPECDAKGYPLGRSVAVLKTEEKGSDVNLAVDLLHDCVNDRFDCGVIVSNDSDLARAVRIVRVEYRKLVGMVNPHRGSPSLLLSRYANFRKRLTETLLASSQFPPVIPIGIGSIHRPPEWS